jgi:hypothetical protein
VHATHIARQPKGGRFLANPASFHPTTKRARRGMGAMRRKEREHASHSPPVLGTVRKGKMKTCGTHEWAESAHMVGVVFSQNTMTS